MLHQGLALIVQIVSQDKLQLGLQADRLRLVEFLLADAAQLEQFSNMLSQLKQAGRQDQYYDVLAEVPRVRKDFGYPPLVTPTSQIVGTQAVLNVLMGRYKMISKESKGLLRGEYGQLPAEVNEEVRKLAIGDDEVITCRPADLIEPELPKYTEETKDVANEICSSVKFSSRIFFFAINFLVYSS